MDLAADARTSISRVVLSPIHFPEELFFKLSLAQQPSMGSVRTNASLQEPQVLQCCAMLVATCDVGDVSKYLDIQTWEVSAVLERPPFLSWVLADTASIGCPAHSGKLAKTSRIFAAVICDSDEPCSVNTAYEPKSSSTTSPRSTTRPLYFWNFCSNFEFLRWHKSISVSK